VGKLIAQGGPLLSLIVIILAITALRPEFANPNNLFIIGLEVSLIAMVAAGQTFAILTSGIDLSVESNVAFTGVIAAILISGSAESAGLSGEGIPSYVAIPIAIGVGILIGLLQGAIITALNIHPFIVTLGFLSILQGASLTVTRGSPIGIVRDDFFNFLLLPIRIGDLRIPMSLIITFLIYLIVWVVLRHTKFGRHVYAMGGNEQAARLSGININRTKVLVYGVSGLLAGIGGVLYLGYIRAGAYQNGTGYTLMSVAAAVIGGTALAGGAGGIWGTLIGVIIIRVVQAGLLYLNVPPNAHQIVIGSMIVLAVALDVIRRGEVSWLRQMFRRRSAT
jgi:ribose/xylose/arabinose/galactoside ABC-type transport system permease subunit